MVIDERKGVFLRKGVWKKEKEKEDKIRDDEW